MTRLITWTDVAGAATVFDGSAGINLMADPVGLEAPNPNLTVDDFVSFDGGVLVNRRRPARSIALKLYLSHATRVETVVSQVASMLQGPGTLQFADGTDTRVLRQVVYEAGLDGSGQSAASRWRVAVVSLIALDPWWYGAANSTALSTSGVTAFDAAISFDAVIPFDGGTGTGVSVVGDAEAYPVITVVGPVTTLTVICNGLSWSIATALSTSQVLIVDHRPGSRGPTVNGAAVDWSWLTEASRLWTLPKGVASVVTSMTGGTGATSVTMSWEPRYLTP